MERSIIKNGALLVVGLVAAVLLSCGTDAKRSVSGPEAFGSLAPRIVFKRASSQAVINIPSLVATVSITLTINGHDTTVSAPRAQGFLEILRVPVGLCLVTVTGKDTSGRIIYSGSIPATILENQTAVPEVDVRQAVPILLYFDSPKNNMVVSNSSITLTGTVTYGSDYSQASNGFLIEGSAPAFTGTSWSKNVTLTEGVNKFGFSIESFKTNQISQRSLLRDTLVVTYSPSYVDTAKPVLTVKGSISDTTQSSSINITGTVSDPSLPVGVTINGVAATVSGNQFALQVALTVGRNTLVIDAYDALNNKTTQTKYVVYNPAAQDSIDPELLVEAPVGNDTVSVRTTRVSGTAFDNSDVSVTVNGQLATIDQLGNWSTDVSVDSAVKYIVITATDKSPNHNAVTVNRTVYFDSTVVDIVPPIVSIKSPGNLATTSLDSIEVSVEANDVTSSVKSVTINGLVAVYDAVQKRYNKKVKLNPGANTIKAIATDTKGNADETQITVTYTPPAIDNQGPSITINDPVANSTVSSRTYTVNATVTDTNGVDSVFFSALPDTSVWITAARLADTTFVADVAMGSAGAKTLWVKACDKASTKNWSRVRCTFNYVLPDLSNPVVVIKSPAPNTTVSTATATIVVTVVDAGGIAKVKFNNDSTSATVTDSTYTYVATLGAGLNVFRIKARDVAGNADSTKSVTITYNAPPAAPTLFTPVTVSATSISVRWSKSAEPDFARYKLFWGLTASVGEGSALGLDTASALISDTARTITGLTPATIYYFKVAVLDGFPSTANSGVVIDTTPLNATVLSSVIGDSIVRLRWNSVSGADRYVVYRSTILSGTYDSVAIATDTVLNNNGLATGTKYFYKIKARKAGFVDAAFSNIDSATTWQAPVIATQPRSQTKIVGQNVVFTVVATGIPTPAYQWKKFGNAIGGATNASYPISAVSLADSGSYSVTITNGTGSIVSLPAALLVNPLTVTDIDGNVYSTVQIGNQVWTRENLRVTKFNDSTAIPLVTDSAAWGALQTPAYCQYDNRTNVDSIKKWGSLYNWHVVNPANVKKIAPAGWHVPTDAEWNTMAIYLNANEFNYDGTTTGYKFAKSLAAKTDWITDTTTGAIGRDLTINNRSGFSALPCGYRFTTFRSIGLRGYWWGTGSQGSFTANYQYLDYSSNALNYNNGTTVLGFSVRLVKD